MVKGIVVVVRNRLLRTLTDPLVVVVVVVTLPLFPLSLSLLLERSKKKKKKKKKIKAMKRIRSSYPLTFIPILV